MTTTRVEITDKLTELVAWVDADGKMWKLEAPAAGLRVERGLPAKAAGKAAGTKPKG